MLTLSDAISTGRISEFVAQEEKRGIGPADKKRLDDLLKEAATKSPQLEDQTSHSTSRGGSNGK